ncbi:O-antigen ligase family protein [Microcella flavibacter]|uniref:O-antigen ligase family protein n=1 Tax=Microcella flavibacter TaxID=1804990 RepID=UPI001E514DF0|nr:O-antigen ligase family protein [Microcella flavibacter]
MSGASAAAGAAAGRGRALLAEARQQFSSPQFSQVLTEVIIVVALCTHAVRAFFGWPGAIAIIVTLVVLAGLSIAGQPDRVEWRGILPVSLIALFSLMVLSVLWSQYNWASVGGVLYALAFAVFGLYIALVRDTIQVVRGVGNGLRWVLTVSLALEVLSGIIIDTPLRFLEIEGSLAVGGPIEGLAGTRNSLAFLAALAALSFWVEYRTRSVPRGLTAYSLALAAACLVFARSPVSWLVLSAVAVAGLALVGLRRMRPESRRAVQGTLLVSALAAVGIGWIFRSPLVDAVDAAADVTARTSVWAQVEAWAALHPVQGWGWVGPWPLDLYPFLTIDDAFGRPAESALNAFVDITLQLGLAGLIALIVALGLALVRAWLVASDRRSTVHVWPALTLVLLLVTSMTESYLLAEGGLMLFVLCAVTAARGRSWRHRLG